MRSLVHGASHLAVWAGLYVAAAVVCLAQVAGIDAEVGIGARIRAAAFAFCTATAVYLLDRVKLRDAWLDPADAQAHPARFEFLARHSGRIRALMAALLIASAVFGSTLTAWGAAIPLLAAAGVIVYAGRPREERPRPKDVVLLKNSYVALGITGFALIVAIAGARPGAGVRETSAFAAEHWVALAFSCAYLAVRVFADAALCDLDDEASDRRHGTGTLPTHLGRERAWSVAMGARLGLAVAMAGTWALPLSARLAWAGVTVVSSLALRVAAPARVREWVDARFGVEAAAVCAVLAVGQKFGW